MIVFRLIFVFRCGDITVLVFEGWLWVLFASVPVGHCILFTFIYEALAADTTSYGPTFYECFHLELNLLFTFLFPCCCAVASRLPSLLWMLFQH